MGGAGGGVGVKDLNGDAAEEAAAVGAGGERLDCDASVRPAQGGRDGGRG